MRTSFVPSNLAIVYVLLRMKSIGVDHLDGVAVLGIPGS